MKDKIAQIKTVLKESKNILITLSKNPSYDAIASSLALGSLCKKLGKKTEIVAYNFTAEKHINFLPNLNSIAQKLEKLKKFTISLDITNTKVDDLDYSIKNNKIEICITPKKGEIENKDIKLNKTNFKYDAIIVVDAENLESLGSVYENNLDFFYQTTIINIDHKPQNERFGQINLIDLSSVSVSEIIYNIFKDEKHLIDAEIATNFLTGIIAKTKSFKTKSKAEKKQKET